MGQTREPDVMIWMPSPSPLILRLLFFNPSVGAIGHRSHAAWGVLEADLSRMRVPPADPLDAPPSRTETVDKTDGDAIDSSKFQGETLDDLQIGRFQGGTLGRLQAGSSEGGTGADLAIPPPDAGKCSKGGRPRRRKTRQGVRGRKRQLLQHQRLTP